MSIWKNHRKEPYYTFVKNGQKTVEGRLIKGKYAEMNVGDHIVVQKEDESESFEVEITALNKYLTFRDMLMSEGLTNVLPDAGDVDDGVSIYRQFYTKEQEVEYGVIAIRVRLI